MTRPPDGGPDLKQYGNMKKVVKFGGSSLADAEQFKKVAATYQRWGKEILNSFDHPYTNGFTEGCNNRIKVLKRVSFGMPRFKRFRRRILHIMLD